MTKRAFDVVFSLLGLILLSPLYAGCALWIKLDSPGPVFFRQRRVGLNGRIFWIHKFRSMVFNAQNGGALLTTANDARVTRCGASLRRWKLDELPQLLDVLVGHRSIVGPRPEVPEYVAHYPEFARRVVLSVRPGITDFASIRFRDESALLREADNTDYYLREILPQKLQSYVDYVGRRTIWLDIKIIFSTLGVLIQRQ